MFANFDFDVIWRSLPYLFRDGLTFPLSLTGRAPAGGLVLGTLFAMLRLSACTPLAKLIAGYVNLIRSLPLVLVIFWFYFLIPYVGQWVLGTARPIPIGAFPAVAITFTLFQAAYFAEIMRAVIQSIPRGQVAPGYALGLTYWQAMRAVARPPLDRNMLPDL